MLSRMSSKWRWFDWIVALFVLVAAVAIIRAVAPDSGFAQGLHQGFHSVALFLAWVANGLNSFSGILEQL